MRKSIIQENFVFPFVKALRIHKLICRFGKYVVMCLDSA